MKEAKSSHQEQGLPMSLVNSTANCNADDLDEETGLEIGADGTRSEKGNQWPEVDETRAVPEFTKKEIQAAIGRLKNGRAGDSNGVRAEDIKKCDEGTTEMMGQIFNEVLRQKDCTPEAWRRVRLKVICKKGDVEEAGTYRPICTLLELHTLFSTLLFIRLYTRLHCGQPADQGGFR